MASSPGSAKAKLVSVFSSLASTATNAWKSSTSVIIDQATRGQEDPRQTLNKAPTDDFPPWWESQRGLYSDLIRSLSQNPNTFLVDAPTSFDFNLHFVTGPESSNTGAASSSEAQKEDPNDLLQEYFLVVAQSALQADESLSLMRFKLVPKQISEHKFWRNYFYRVSLIRQKKSAQDLQYLYKELERANTMPPGQRQQNKCKGDASVHPQAEATSVTNELTDAAVVGRPIIERLNQAQMELKIAQDNANLLRDVIKTLSESLENSSSSDMEAQQVLLQELLNSCKESKKTIATWVVELSDKLQSSPATLPDPNTTNQEELNSTNAVHAGQTRFDCLRKLFSEMVQVNESLQEVLSLYNKHHQQQIRRQQQLQKQQAQETRPSATPAQQQMHETEIEFISDDIPELGELAMQDSWKSQLRRTLGLSERSPGSSTSPTDNRRLPWEIEENDESTTHSSDTKM